MASFSSAMAIRHCSSVGGADQPQRERRQRGDQRQDREATDTARGAAFQSLTEVLTFHVPKAKLNLHPLRLDLEQALRRPVG